MKALAASAYVVQTLALLVLACFGVVEWTTTASLILGSLAFPPTAVFVAGIMRASA